MSKKPAASGGSVKARVLVACVISGEQRKPDDVVELDETTLAVHVADVDPSPAAVKYAESLK